MYEGPVQFAGRKAILSARRCLPKASHHFDYFEASSRIPHLVSLQYRLFGRCNVVAAWQKFTGIRVPGERDRRCLGPGTNLDPASLPFSGDVRLTPFDL